MTSIIHARSAVQAKRSDMEKVINVVRRQLLAVIGNPDKMPADVERFKQMVFANHFEDIKAQEAARMDVRLPSPFSSFSLL